MTYTLRTPRLVLHPYNEFAVTQQHVDWLNDRELMQYSEQRHFVHTMKSQYEYARQVKFAEDHSISDKQLLWLIQGSDGKDGYEDLGTISANIDLINKRANLGILIGSRPHQGMGLAAEAWNAVVDWLFSQNCHKVEAGCREDNWKMRRLAVTTGMTFEGQIPSHFKVGETFVDLILYGRFKTDTAQSPWNEMFKHLRPDWKDRDQ